MLRTKSLISTIDEVPREWVFEHYLKLGVKLTGQDVRIKSVFNASDKTPSMFIYIHPTTKSYRFKDFSTDKSGDGVTLILEMFKLSTRGESAHKIIQDYNKYMLSGNKEDYNLREFKIQSRYKVSEHTKRNWNVGDKKFWTKFYIGSDLLAEYFVYPLESYRMVKDIDGVEQSLVIKGDHIYGYFRKDGTLYKIYQPYLKDNKFIKVKDYTQGLDQLTFTTPYLIILSSLKDMMFFKKLRFKNAEVIAPDAENILIPKHVIDYLKTKYKGICCLFDNDDAGKKAMVKYQETYGLPGVYLEMSKDLSDSGKDYGINKVRETVTPLLKQALTPEQHAIQS